MSGPHRPDNRPATRHIQTVLIKRAMLEGIRRGEVNVAFRRWARPTVKPTTMLRTAVGVVAIDQVERVESRAIGDDDAVRAGFAGRRELLESLRGEGALYRIELHFVGADPRVALREKRVLSDDDQADVLLRLASLDKRARQGPYTERFLSLIAGSPGRPAAALAAELGLETLPFKAQVRKLKELGLTESLEVGYRLSPRGHDVLSALRKAR